MTTPNDRGETVAPDPAPSKSNTDEATIRAEEDLQDRETEEEALLEALKLDAVPFERAKHEQDG